MSQQTNPESPPQQSAWQGLPYARAMTAGLITVIVGVTSSVALVFTGAEKAGASPAQIGSWIGALCIGKALCSIFLSVRYKTPFLFAWSTPGAALLTATDGRATLNEYVGAFILCGLLLIVTGATGIFDRVIDRIPLPIASALLAGVLARFAIEAFGYASETNADSTAEVRVLIISMFVAFVIARRLFPNFAALAVLVVGLAIAVLQGTISLAGVDLGLVDPSFVKPGFDLSVLIGIGIPLFIVTMAAQNVPGTAALRTHGYDDPVSPAITASGIATTLLAPFGLFAINLSAITAAMVMSPDIHPDKKKRWPAAVAAALVYLTVGVLGGSVASLISVLPRPLVIAVAAFALLPTIANGLAGATADANQRDAAIVVFLITVSGLTIFHVGAAFWALLAGIFVLLARRIPTVK
jgi:benzoate membrane transport protein